MKRVIITAMALCLILALSVSAQEMGMKNKMMLSAYGGYTMGMGDAFDDVETEHYKMESSATLNFGANFHYGVAPKILVGADVFAWMWKVEAEAVGTIPGGITLPAADETNLQFAILGSALYHAYTQEKQDLFLQVGVGPHFLDGGEGGSSTEFGVMAGGFYKYMVSPKVGVFFMPRWHMLFSDPSAMLIQLSAGVSIPLGS